MTEAVYTATAEYIVEMERRPVKHRVSVSGVLKRLGVSRSGYHAWKKRCPSAAEKHRGEGKEKRLKIYEDSHQNYGAPKITRELWKGGEKIAVKTVANYMRQMGIKAQWIKPYTQTTIDSDFSKELRNILNEQFNPEHPLNELNRLNKLKKSNPEAFHYWYQIYKIIQENEESK